MLNRGAIVEDESSSVQVVVLGGVELEAVIGDVSVELAALVVLVNPELEAVSGDFRGVGVDNRA